MTNKDFAFSCLNALKEAGQLTDTALHLLTNPDSCRQLFHCSSGFSILLEIPVDCSEEKLHQLCHTGSKRRYYQDRFHVANRTFVITNHWYGPNRSMPDNRTPFLNWVKEKLSSEV